MGVIFIIIWVVLSLSCMLIIPIGIRIEKLNDNHRLKKWWMKHIVKRYPDEDNLK